MTSAPTPELHLRELARLRRVCDLMTRRVERGMALLRRGDLSVTEVCLEVGCASLGTFTTRFTELVGMPPWHLPARGAGRDGRDAVVHREASD